MEQTTEQTTTAPSPRLPSVGKGHPWRRDEDDQLRRLYPDHTLRAIATIIGRSVNGVRNRCSVLGLRKKVPNWTTNEIAQLTERDLASPGACQIGISDLARELGRPRTSISAKARELGLTARGRTHPDPVDRAAIAQRKKREIATIGHPRGMLGHRHTIETKQRIATASRHYHASLEPHVVADRVNRANTTKVERYGTAGPEVHLVTNP